MRIILVLWCLSLVGTVICMDSPPSSGGKKKNKASAAWGWFKSTGIGQKITSGGREAGQKIAQHKYVQQAKNHGEGLVQQAKNHKDALVQQANYHKEVVAEKVGQAYQKVKPRKGGGGGVNGAEPVEYNIGDMYGEGLIDEEVKKQQSAAKKHPPASQYHGPCVQYCANSFGFVFKSTSTDGKLRFSDGVVFPMVRGRVNPMSRWKSIKEWKNTGEYNHIPHQCDCITTTEFKQLMEENELGLKQFENLKKYQVKEAHQFSLGALNRLNDKVGGSPLYAYLDHRGLIALILAEMTSNTEDPVRRQAESAIRRSKSTKEVYLSGPEE